MNHFMDLITQPDDITCGPTSTAMILRFYGKNVEVNEIKKITKTVWYSKGDKDFGMTAPELIRICLKKYNLNAKIKTGNIKKLKCVVGSGKPCIVLIRSGEWNWHYVIVIGYDKEMIYYANPTDAEIDALSVDEFDRAWNWTSDIRGRSCSWWISFWLRVLEIYPRTYVYVDSNI